jgi:outer membrane lipoprotein-sorting protein
VRTRRLTVVVLPLAALVFAACGGNQSARSAMEAKFRSIDYKMANLETTSVAYNQTYITKATQQYVALVHHYADLLGPNEARRRLVAKGNEIEPYCPPCDATLVSAAARY